MLREAIPLRRLFHAIRQHWLKGDPAAALLEQFTRRQAESAALLQARASLRPSLSYPEELPVSAQRALIAKTIAENQVTVLCGATGSGKTTQLPKICLELGRGVAGMIGHTQPRRIAARSVAQRIADEVHSHLGDAVGYKVRFTDHVSDATLVKLMTDGILLAEIQRDRMLWQYDTLIIDEAHERSLNIDFLLGYLRQLLPRRRDLRLIITSATIAPERFAAHFGGAPILLVEGRTYPVEVRYRPPSPDDEPDVALTTGVLRAVDELWSDGPGDALLFFPGEREIRETAEALRKHHPPHVEVMPLYSRLSADEQMRVFAPHHHPRLVLATNIAETSLTVPGIRYVVDTGLARISRYSAGGTVQRLPIEPISQASAEQRKGRCGRTSPGVCIRLYSEQDYTARPEFTDPEIRRTHLASVILQMKALRLGRIEDFPFLDPPDYRQIRDGYQILHELSAIDEQNELTEVGRLLARLPVDPRLARMLLEANTPARSCLTEMLIIVSALSVQDPRERPMDQQAAADTAHREFRDEGSDFLAYLKLWQWFEQQQRHLSENKLRKLCRDRFLSYVRLREWRDIHSQLKQLTADMGWHPRPQPAPAETIHRALIAGLLSHVGTRGEDFEYQGLRGRHFYLFPASAQFEKKPRWVIAAELVQTSRLYARTVAPIQPEWIEQAAGHMVRREYSDPMWNPRRGMVTAHEKVSLHGLVLIPRRTIDYSTVDPRVSRELFIQGALVRGELEGDAPFFRHNARLRREVEMLEAMQRRHDLLVDARSIYDFYDARVPAGVFSLQTFHRWRHEAEQRDRRLLFMQKSDLLQRSAEHITPQLFPAALRVGSTDFALEYRFDVTDPADGVSVVVPLSQINQLPPPRLPWLVPGLLEELLVELIRGLPREFRTQLVPAPQFARQAAARMRFGEGDFFVAAADALGHLIGRRFDPDLLRGESLHPYLRMNVRVVDERGRLVMQGRDLAHLTGTLQQQARRALALQRHAWNRDGLRSWNFPDLPVRVEFQNAGVRLQGYPGLVDTVKHVGLRLFETQAAAEEELRRGARRLLILALDDALNWQFKITPGIDDLLHLYRPLGDKLALREHFILTLADRLLYTSDDAPLVRTRAEFEPRLDAAWNQLRPAAEELCRLATAALREWGDVRPRLLAPAAPMLENSYADMRRHLASLMPADFLPRTPRKWLPHLPRFLAALRLRHQKLINAGLARDTAIMTTLQPLEAQWQTRIDKARQNSTPDPAAAELRWLLEELHVSLFAQELKTSLPMSEVRMKRLLESSSSG